MPQHDVTYATILVGGYSLFYVLVDRIGGLMYTVLLFSMYRHVVKMLMNDRQMANKKYDCKTVNWTGTGRCLKLALYSQLLAWYLQIHPGHAIFEGAKPAILSAIGQTLSIAPLFAFYEGLWFIGINKQLQEQTLPIVAENTVRLCEGGAAMRVCESL